MRRPPVLPSCVLALAGVLAGCDIHFGGGADDATDPDDQCVELTVAACADQGLSPPDCADLIQIKCEMGGDPGTPCNQQAFDECVAQGNDPASCQTYADGTCGGDPGDPNGGCFEMVFTACIQMGGDPMTCTQRANDSCTGEPPPPPPPGS